MSVVIFNRRYRDRRKINFAGEKIKCRVRPAWIDLEESKKIIITKKKKKKKEEYKRERESFENKIKKRC